MAVLTLPGTSDYVALSDVAAYRGAAWTYEGWVRCQAWAGGYAFGNFGTSYGGVYMVLDQVLGPLVYYLSGGTPTYLSDPTYSTPSALDTWQHCAVSWDGTTCRLTADGVEVATTTDAPDAATDQFVIGSSGTTVAGWLNGELADVRVWSDYRTEAEIAANLDVRLVGTETGLEGYWPLDEGTGTTATDGAGSNDGTLTGDATWSTDDPPLAVTEHTVPVLAVGVALPLPAGLVVVDMPASVAVSIALVAPSFSWAVPIGTRPQTIYSLTLTGAADATTDVVLPMASFQTRLSYEQQPSQEATRDSGDPPGYMVPAEPVLVVVDDWWVLRYPAGTVWTTTYTPALRVYLQAVVPDPATWAAAVAARPNGQLVISRGVRLADGSETYAEISRADLETIADDRGGVNASLSLQGNRQSELPTAKSRNLTGVHYRRTGSGLRQYRCTPDNFLMPGDTAVFPELSGESITVGRISYAVSAAREQMDITEAEAA